MGVAHARSSWSLREAEESSFPAHVALSTEVITNAVPKRELTFS